MFELSLSRGGIEVRRPDRPVQTMSWDRVSEWEIEERKGYVLLTLRGQGATTPLVVPGWTLDDLEVLMREITSDTATSESNGSAPVVDTVNDRRPTVAVASATQAPAPAVPVPDPVPEPVATAQEATQDPAPVVVEHAAPARPATPTRAERRQRARRGAGWGIPWKAVVTVVLLGVLATAVILVLLQSAGIIDWSFLGPVA